jgi:LacI family transcriptional regulator
MKSRPSLSDVAKETGYAKATVSLALRDSPEIAAATREAIKEGARRIGYTPDPLWSQRARGRWGAKVDRPAIGILYETMESPRFYIPMLEERALALGYTVEVEGYSSAREISGIDKRLYARGVRGLVFLPQHRGSPDSLPFRWEKYAAVCCGQGFLPTRLPVIRADVFAAVRTAWESLSNLGYRRIGVAPCEHQTPIYDDYLRQGAALQLVDSAPRIHKRIPIYKGAMQDYGAFRKWVERNRPDAVIGFHHGMLMMLRSMGRMVPNDTGFCSLESMGAEGCACVESRYDIVAMRAIEALDWRILHARTGLDEDFQEEILIEPRWRNGPTVREVRAARD